MRKFFSIFLKQQKTHCDECGKPLLVNSYKDGESELCGLRCLEIKRLKRSAGMQSSWLIGAIILSIFMVCFAVTPKARAQHQGHDLHHDNAYSKWMQNKPNETLSCCNKKDYDKGSGDCYPTEAELRGSGKDIQWWAKRDTGEWIPIPESKIIRERNPDLSGVTAHICEQNGKVLCFVGKVGSL